MKQQFDPIFDKVVEEVIQLPAISIPFLQRRFLIGYSRALRIICQLEKIGCIEKGKPNSLRKVLKKMRN